MGRRKGEPTAVKRLPLSEARKLAYIAKRLGIKFKDAFRRIAGADIDRLYKRLKDGEHIELGENGGA